MAEDIQITLRYQGIEYTYTDTFEPWIDKQTGEVERTPLEVALYMYEEGNYSCDCNKSLFLGRYCDVDFSQDERAKCKDGEWELPCGDTIELVSPRYEDTPSRPQPTITQRASGLFVVQFNGSEASD